MKVGGLQCVITNDAYVLPLNIVNGLPYLPMRPHTDEEWEKLPHAPLTQDNEWNPASLDSVITDTDKWADAFKEIMKDERWDQKSDLFDEKGYHLSLEGCNC